jgi:hypothetical protein
LQMNVILSPRWGRCQSPLRSPALPPYGWTPTEYISRRSIHDPCDLGCSNLGRSLCPASCFPWLWRPRFFCHAAEVTAMPPGRPSV